MSQDVTRRAIMGGVALIVGVVLALTASGLADSYDYDSVLTIDTEQEWLDNDDVLTGVEVTQEGYVQLEESNTTGTYESENLMDEADRWDVYASLEEPDNSSVYLVVDGVTYELEDGFNSVEVDNAVSDYSFELNFDRDADTVESPQVDTLEAQLGEESMTSFIVLSAFGLLLLFVVARLIRDLGGRSSVPE